MSTKSKTTGIKEDFLILLIWVMTQEKFEKKMQEFMNNATDLIPYSFFLGTDLKQEVHHIFFCIQSKYKKTKETKVTTLEIAKTSAIPDEIMPFYKSVITENDYNGTLLLDKQIMLVGVNYSIESLNVILQNEDIAKLIDAGTSRRHYDNQYKEFLDYTIEQISDNAVIE